jgi:hypothetical protein
MRIIIWVSLGILFLGFLIFGILVWKAKRKHNAIKHYEEIRDKLSVREAEEQTGITESEFNEYGGFNLGSIVGGFVTILVGASLLGPISDAVNEATTQMNASGNLTAEAQAVLQITPGFFVVAVVIIGVSIVWRSLRNSGLF